MKNIYKISTIVLMSVIMVISSCKKDSDDDPVVGTPIYGCTDILAFNFIPITGDSLIDVNTDDGSCIYAYDIAQGVWNITPDCDEIDILGQVISLNEQMPETIDVQGNEGYSLSIDMNGTQVVGYIDSQGAVTVNEQTVSIEFSGFSIPVQVSGTGEIESEASGYMDLTYSGEIDVIPNMPIPLPFSATCHLVLTK